VAYESHSSCDSFLEFFDASWCVRIHDAPIMSEIEWNIIHGLGNDDNRFADSVSHSNLL
jgi:hypothetical protein